MTDRDETAAGGRADDDQAATAAGEQAPPGTAGEASPAGGPAMVAVVWEAPFWGRPTGHRETLEVTDTVLGALRNGLLSLENPAAAPKEARRAARTRAPARRSKRGAA